jgi:hypothetical protein
MKRYVKLAAALAIAGFAAGCSRISKVLFMSMVIVGLSACSKDDTAATTNEFSSLPEVTGPVTTNGATSIGNLSASTGVLLGSPSFLNTNSRPMCENVNLLKEVLREAAGPDKILCYMGAMKSSGVIPGTLDLADGEYHYIKLQNLSQGREATEPVVKFQIVKTDGVISSFKMYSCFGGSTTPTQSEYISQTFVGTNATIITKNVGSQTDGADSQSYGSSMTTTGVYDSGWSSKNITGFRYYSSTGTYAGSNVTTINLDQYADQVNMAIAMKGLYGGNLFTNKFYTQAQLIGSTLATFALGDGSSKVSMSYDEGNNSSVEFSDSGTIAWDGDTKDALGDATTSAYYVGANAGTIPNTPDDTQVVTFGTGETWDCALPDGASWTNADFTVGGATVEAGMAACEAKFLGNGQWYQCPYN